MERSKGVVFAVGILFLFAVWDLVQAGLGFWGGGEVAAVPEGLEGLIDWEEFVRRGQISSAMSGVLNAGILILAGIGVFSLAGWSRPLGLVLGFWYIFASLITLLAGFFLGEGSGRVRGMILGMILLLGSVLLIWTLFRASVKADLSPRVPRPRGLTVLGLVYFIQGFLIANFFPSAITFPSSALIGVPPWILVVVFLVLALYVSVSIILAIGLLDFRSWARTLVLIFAWIAVSASAVAWVILLTTDPSKEAVGRYIAQTLIGLPISFFALWYLTRFRVKELFLPVG